jgi:hypothetical protein
MFAAWKTKFSESTASLTDTIKTKAPKAHKALCYIGDVWCETFPNEEKKILSRI